MFIRLFEIKTWIVQIHSFIIPTVHLKFCTLRSYLHEFKIVYTRIWIALTRLKLYTRNCTARTHKIMYTRKCTARTRKIVYTRKCTERTHKIVYTRICTAWTRSLFWPGTHRRRNYGARIWWFRFILHINRSFYSSH